MNGRTSIEFLESLKWQIRYRSTVLAHIEEFWKWCRNDAAGGHVQDQAPRRNGDLVPSLLENTVTGIDVEVQPISRLCLGHETIVTRRRQSLDQLSER
jgi:hypothetical protein